jgi:hypothetical protein
MRDYPGFFAEIQRFVADRLRHARLPQQTSEEQETS